MLHENRPGEILGSDGPSAETLGFTEITSNTLCAGRESDVDNRIAAAIAEVRLMVWFISINDTSIDGRQSKGITASPDGKLVLAIDYADPKFYAIDTATDKIVDTVPVEKNTVGPFRARYSPDGSMLITVNHVDAIADAMNRQM